MIEILTASFICIQSGAELHRDVAHLKLSAATLENKLSVSEQDIRQRFDRVLEHSIITAEQQHRTSRALESELSSLKQLVDVADNRARNSSPRLNSVFEINYEKQNQNLRSIQKAQTALMVQVHSLGSHVSKLDLRVRSKSRDGYQQHLSLKHGTPVSNLCGNCFPRSNDVAQHRCRGPLQDIQRFPIETLEARHSGYYKSSTALFDNGYLMSRAIDHGYLFKAKKHNLQMETHCQSGFLGFIIVRMYSNAATAVLRTTIVIQPAPWLSSIGV